MEPILATLFDRCDLYERRYQKVDGRDKETLVLASENVACALSYLQRQEAKEGDRAFAAYLCSLFLPRGTEVPSGGAVLVRHEGEALWFEAVGEPKRYPSHCELTVRRRKEL